jgi:hypothetical protein
MTAAHGAGLAVILGRTAHPVGTGQVLDVGAVLGQLRQPGGQIFQLFGHHMDHAGFRLDPSAHRDIARTQDHRPHAFEYFRPHDDIGDRAFILEGHEHHAVGRARPLPAGDQT